MTQAVQSELQCPDCAGQCVFSPKAQGLECQSCGEIRALDPDRNHAAHSEFPFDPNAPPAEHVDLEGSRIYQCRTCGGEIVFTGPALSERCPYCDGSVVLGKEGSAYQTMALIPFRITGDDALDLARAWVAGRWAAPGDLAAVFADGRVAGIYAPFWTFDSEEALEYWATYVTGSGKHKRRQETSGRMTIAFDDLLMPASDHVTPLIRDGILHDFRPKNLRPYRAGYLAGFAAERHHQTVAEGLRDNASDKRLLIRNRIKSHIGKSRVTSIRYETDTSGIHYRRILLPVWILHYRYADSSYKVVVSGIDGRTFGERPFSRFKLILYSVLFTSIAIGLGMLWGSSAAM